MGRLHGGRIAGGALLALLAACSGSISSMDERTPGAPGASSVNGPGSGVNGPSGDGPAGSNANAPGGSDENGDGTDPMNGGAPGAVQALRCETKAVGPSPMRRLTHTEYDNAVRDLLGDTTQPARDFAVDTQVGLFDNTASAQTVPVLLGDQYVDAAVTLAERIGDVGAFAGCDPAGAAGAACVSGFVDAFGRRAYRRPLTAAERDGLIAIYDDVRAASDADTGIRAVVTAAPRRCRARCRSRRSSSPRASRACCGRRSPTTRCSTPRRAASSRRASRCRRRRGACSKTRARRPRSTRSTSNGWGCRCSTPRPRTRRSTRRGATRCARRCARRRGASSTTSSGTTTRA
jgi:hypothetical protein